MGCVKSKTPKKYEVVVENGVQVTKEVEVKVEEVLPASAHKKIIFLGNDYVGKTSIIRQYTEDTFEEYVPPTSIVSNFDKTIETAGPNGKPMKLRLQIWDSPGEDTYRNIRKNFFQGSQAIVIVYDVTCSKSFKEVSSHLSDVQEVCQTNVPVIIVGTKSDLADARKVSFKNLADLAAKIKAKHSVVDYFEVSSIA